MEVNVLSAQRRIELKGIETQTKLERDAGALRECDGRVRTAMEAVRTSGRNFEQIKQRIAAKLELGSSARELAGNFALGLRALQDQRSQILESRRALVIANAGKIQQEQIVRARRHALDCLERCAESLVKNRERIRRAAEDADCLSAGISRHYSTVELPITARLVGAVSPASTNESPKIGTTAASVTKPGPSHVYEVSTVDNAEQSKISFTVGDERQSEIAVRIVRRGERSLDVQIMSQGYGDQRRLWQDQAELRAELERAGYRIERLRIGNADRRLS